MLINPRNYNGIRSMGFQVEFFSSNLNSRAEIERLGKEMAAIDERLVQLRRAGSNASAASDRDDFLMLVRKKTEIRKRMCSLLVD